MAASMPSRTRKNPSAVRSPVTNRRSRSSTSDVSSAADSASVRAISTVGVSATSAASRAAVRVRSNCSVGTSALPLEVAALLLGRELVLEVHARGAGLDHGAHQLERVQGPPEAGFGIGDDRREPVPVQCAGRPRDLVRPAQRVLIRRTTAGTELTG